MLADITLTIVLALLAILALVMGIRTLFSWRRLPWWLDKLFVLGIIAAGTAVLYGLWMYWT